MSKILIFVESFSIGDTVGALPYIEKYVLNNKMDEIHVSINDWLIPFFKEPYSSIHFVGKNSSEIYDKILPLVYQFHKPLQQGYAEQLGFINGEYLRPKVLIPELNRPINNKYITIGIHSTAQLKYWNHPTGKRVQTISPYWNELCGMIRKSGYTPVVVEENEMFGIPPHRNGMPRKANKKFGQSFLESMNLIYHSEFYIGLSSGMSWIAHAMGKKVAMIANFTEDWNEFDLSLDDYIRITNKNVCHGCWNLIGNDFDFDTQDWYWCPKHKGTEKEFECHKSITPEMVFNEIKKWID
jgi:autotransporter strand-loop-strand O-heptosyltransferase